MLNSRIESVCFTDTGNERLNVEISGENSKRVQKFTFRASQIKLELGGNLDVITSNRITSNGKTVNGITTTTLCCGL